MIIQERDKSIIKLCYEQGFLNTEHVHKGFYSHASIDEARRRIRELQSSKLIRSEVVSPISKVRVLRLTQDGLALAKNLSIYDVPQTKRCDIATLLHDSIVTSVRLRLSSLWDGQWVPEKALKDRYEIIPDGMIQFDSGVSIAIEVENSSKGKKRFLEILSSWSKVSQLKLVLYIATSPTLKRLIEGYLAHAPQNIVFGVINWSDLENGTPFVSTPRGELDLFSKRSFG